MERNTKDWKSLNTALYRADLQGFKPFNILVVDENLDRAHTLCKTLGELPNCQHTLNRLKAHSIADARSTFKTERNIAIAIVFVTEANLADYISLIAYVRQQLNIELTRFIFLSKDTDFSLDDHIRIEYDLEDCWPQQDISPNHLSTLISSNLRHWTQLRALKRSKIGLENIIASTKIIASQPDLESYAKAALEQARYLNRKVKSGFAAFIDTENHPYSLDLSIISGVGEYADQINCKLSELPNQQAKEICLRSLVNQKNISNGQHIVLMFQTQVLEHRQLFLLYFHCSESLAMYESDLLWFFSENLSSSFQNLRLMSRTSRLAYVDYSTGAYNRNWLLKKLKQIPPIERYNKYLLVFEINNFAEMNITFGEDFCQLIIKQIYQKIVTAFGENSHVCHPTMDEFALLIPRGKVDAELIEQFCAQTVVMDGSAHSVPLTAAVVPLSEIDNMSSGQLLGLGESLVDLNRKHHETFRCFDHSISQAVSDRYTLLHHLRQALINEDISIALQPKVELDSGNILGFEALARWRTRDGEEIPPSEFIAVAEKAGMIQQLGLYILDKTFDAIRQLVDAGIRLPVAFNVSVSQLIRQESFEQLVAQILGSGIDLSLLEIEITESEYIEDYDAIQARLQTLSDIGIELSIDDFGTGYSSLSHIYQLSAKTIKIDRVFVEQLEQDGAGAAIIDVVVRLGHHFGYRVLAEGIETETQRQQLLRLGCSFGQGFLFAPAMDIDELLLWLSASQMTLLNTAN